jgi:cold shock CspA family protein
VKELKREKGVVSRMSYEAGYGMIAVPPDPQEYFFHASDVKIENEGQDPVFEDFNTGDVVMFTPLRGKRGWKGLGVEKVNG